MAISICGFGFKPADLPGPYHRIWRVYGSREVFKYPGGRIAPQPGTWQLVTEFMVKKSRGKVLWPALELEPTDGDDWRFYNLVPVNDEGREVWHADNELVLPHNLPDEFDGHLDVAEWILYNLELKGFIAPGQLHE